MHPFTRRELAGGTAEPPFLKRFFDEPSSAGWKEVSPVLPDEIMKGGMPPVVLGGLKAFVASTPRCAAGILAYNGAAPVPLGDRLWAVPLGLLLS